MALKGIKVLELSGLAPGPFCGMILADFGASVIRVDKFNSSDLDCLGNGKRSILLNLKSKEGINIFKRLSKETDIIIDPYRKGVMERLKLGPLDLMTSNKGLIYARLTGYGQDGPYANMAGHDINYLGLSGLLSCIGHYKEKPIPPINLAADFGGGGLTCALGIMMALLERTQSKKGQIVDVSMVEGTAYLGSWVYRSQSIPGLWDQPRGKNILDSGAHFYNTYKTKDEQYIAVGAIEPQFYAVFLEKLGLSENEMPHYSNFESSQDKLTEIFKTKTQDEWCTVFDESDACVTPVLALKNVLSHKHNNFLKSFAIGKDDVIVPKPSPHLSRTPGKSCAIHNCNINSGEHTIEILTEYKYNSDEIKKFIKLGVVEQAVKGSKL